MSMVSYWSSPIFFLRYFPNYSRQYFRSCEPRPTNSEHYQLQYKRVLQWDFHLRIPHRAVVTYCSWRYFEEFEALTHSSLVCTLPSLLGRRTCSDHAMCHFYMAREEQCFCYILMNVIIFSTLW